ncbi:MAG: J domain-containing protein [Thermomicrobiales bacterium]|nr:J domain-containing protein [Thermomicrobiales bacterium]MCA9880981.1 J domain-containing protein [Thermomicrobiales bacterium]
MTSRQSAQTQAGPGPVSGSDPDQEDHYSLLGVPFTATNAEITRAYRLAMKRAHPDRQSPEQRAVAEETARRLNAAYTVLCDPIKRQAYDRTIRQQVIQDHIMRQYVGGFSAGGGASSYPAMERPEPTAAERRERVEADRRAWLLLIGFAAVFTVTIIVVLVASAVFGSLVDAFR